MAVPSICCCRSARVPPAPLPHPPLPPPHHPALLLLCRDSTVGKIILRQTRDGRPSSLCYAASQGDGAKPGGWIRVGPFPSGAFVWFSAAVQGCCPAMRESLPMDASADLLAHAGGRHWHAQPDCGPSRSVQVRCHTWDKNVTEARAPRLDAEVPLEGRSSLLQRIMRTRTVTAPADFEYV